jgi:hypothetical protein
MARWLERDPAGYVDGPSLYGYLGRSPVDGIDPSGLVGIQDGSLDSFVRPMRAPPMPPGGAKIAGGIFAMGGSAAAGVGLTPFLGPVGVGIGAGGFMYGADLFWTGVEECRTGTEQCTRTHAILVDIVGEESAERIELAIAVVDVGHGVLQLGLTGWKYAARYAPGKRPGFGPGAAAQRGSNITYGFGHTWKKHGESQFFNGGAAKRAEASGKPNGVWLDDDKAKRYLEEVLPTLGPGEHTVDLPAWVPGGEFLPDGTFRRVNKVRILKSGKYSCETAYPIYE